MTSQWHKYILVHDVCCPLVVLFVKGSGTNCSKWPLVKRHCSAGRHRGSTMLTKQHLTAFKYTCFTNSSFGYEIHRIHYISPWLLLNALLSNANIVLDWLVSKHPACYLVVSSVIIVIKFKLEQLERLRSENTPNTPWLPILMIHIRSQVKKYGRNVSRIVDFCQGESRQIRNISEKLKF